MEIRTQKLENKRVKHMIRWHSWIGYAALFWSVLYGIINFYWLQGGEGYPFIQESGTGIFSALFTYLPVQAGSIIFCVLCIFGLFISLAMNRPWGANGTLLVDHPFFLDVCCFLTPFYP